MIGIVHLFITAFGYIGGKIQDTFVDAGNKHNRMRNYHGHTMWLDQEGRWRDAKTDEHLIVGTKNIGDDHVYIFKANNGEIIKDITQENLDACENKSKQDAMAKGETVYMIGGIYDDHRRDQCVGHRWKDMETGDIYVTRKMFGSEVWFMRISDGQFIKQRTPRKNVSQSWREYRDSAIKRINQDQKKKLNYYNGRVFI